MTEAQIPGQEPKPSQEQEAELASPLLIFAQKSLGFVESDEMREARENAIAGSENSDDAQFINQLDRYQELAEQAVDRLTLARAVASAHIYHAANKPTLYREEMAEAIEFARNMGFNEEAQRLTEMQLEIFKQDYIQGMGDFELYTEFSLSPDPFSLRFDSRTFDDLSDAELMVAREVIFSQLGISPEKIAEMKVRKYVSQTDEHASVPGKIEVRVFRTEVEGYEGIFLQELIMPDGKPSWMVGPDEDL